MPLAGMALAAHGGGRDRQLVLSLWPGKALGDFGSFPEEGFRPPSTAPTPNAKWLTNVTNPTITVFRPSKDRNTGAAMIVCPGGGYWNLAWDLEGEEVAAWLASAGITGIVLKYRVPRRPGQPEPLPAPGPVLDAQRAISLVRSRATDWRIDPNRIGIGGFSAGGHLALTAATNFDKRSYEPIDEIDRVSCRPDFAVAIYSGYLVEKDRDVLAPYIRIPHGTPPVFLAHAGDDTMAGSEHSVVMYLALKRAGVPAELHVYASGEHGFGVRKSAKPCSTWTDRCLAWLRDQGLLRSGPATRKSGDESMK
jgi:acetyl esterase/lipase